MVAIRENIVKFMVSKSFKDFEAVDTYEFRVELDRLIEQAQFRSVWSGGNLEELYERADALVGKINVLAQTPIRYVLPGVHPRQWMYQQQSPPVIEADYFFGAGYDPELEGATWLLGGYANLSTPRGVLKLDHGWMVLRPEGGAEPTSKWKASRGRLALERQITYYPTASYLVVTNDEVEIATAIVAQMFAVNGERTDDLPDIRKAVARVADAS